MQENNRSRSVYFHTLLFGAAPTPESVFFAMQQIMVQVLTALKYRFPMVHSVLTEKKIIFYSKKREKKNRGKTNPEGAALYQKGVYFFFSG